MVHPRNGDTKARLAPRPSCPPALIIADREAYFSVVISMRRFLSLPALVLLSASGSSEP